MRVFAESQVAREVPFVHLGYTAALINHIGAPVYGGALLALIGVLLALSPPKDWRATPRVRLICLGVAVAGGLSIWAGVRLAEGSRDRQMAGLVTWTRIH